MTGRGNNKFFHPHPEPIVRIGLTLSTTSPILDPTSSSPFFVVVSARVLTSPNPASPITLCTFLNPLDSLHDRSFENIKCVSPDTEAHKHIEIWPRGWPHYIWDPEDLRDGLPFVTLQPDKLCEVKLEIPQEKIAAANLVVGEKYRVELTNKGLGTKWWTFGSLDEAQGIRYREWEEGESEEGEDKNGRYTIGKDPRSLALVIEKGEAEFEVG